LSGIEFTNEYIDILIIKESKEISIPQIELSIIQKGIGYLQRFEME